MQSSVLLLLAALAINPLAASTRDAVESPHLTMRELGREHRAVIRRDEEHEQRRSLVAKITGTFLELPVQAESVVTRTTISAPRVTAGFAGSHDLGFSPSDAAGAVSAKYLLHASNASILAQDRTGATLSNIPLGSFWHDSAYADGFLYDSRVSYDAAADRWIICTLSDINLKKSTLLLAVSDGGNPSLGWHRYRFLVDPTDEMSADFTRMALTRDAIVVTANMFDAFDAFSELADAFVVRKSDAFAGAATLPVTQTHTGIYDLVPVDSLEGALPYFVTQRGTIDLSIYTLSGGALASQGNPQAPALPITGVTSSIIGLQLGSALKLDCGFTYVYNAVLRNGVLWVASQPYGISPLRSSVMWWKITLGSPLRVDTGFIDDPTGATMYAFPSIAVNKVGAALIAYCVFSASTYPSAGFSYVDPFNSLSAPAVLKGGDGPSHISRWADFSTTVVDANDIDFWTMQTYSPLLTSGLWAAWWSRVEMPLPARRRAVR